LQNLTSATTTTTTYTYYTLSTFGNNLFYLHYIFIDCF
jgi:hypothetical protein